MWQLAVSVENVLNAPPTPFCLIHTVRSRTDGCEDGPTHVPRPSIRAQRTTAPLVMALLWLKPDLVSGVGRSQWSYKYKGRRYSPRTSHISFGSAGASLRRGVCVGRERKEEGKGILGYRGDGFWKGEGCGDSCDGHLLPSDLRPTGMDSSRSSFR